MLRCGLSMVVSGSHTLIGRSQPQASQVPLSLPLTVDGNPTNHAKARVTTRRCFIAFSGHSSQIRARSSARNLFTMGLPALTHASNLKTPFMIVFIVFRTPSNRPAS